MKDKTISFTNKAKLIHGDKYDYSNVNYIHSKRIVDIICQTHGSFSQTPNTHLSGSGCFNCNKISVKSKNNFTNKAKLIHGDKYDYSNVNYIKNNIKVEIICPIHGSFNQTPLSHLNGCSCPKCNSNKLDNKIFIDRAKAIHGDKYDYSKINYVKSKIKINIVCPTHGEFKQSPNHHLKGVGCPICKESKGERDIKYFLNKNNIEFIPQKRFKDCRDKKPLPFDFYLPSHNICIEFNGRQHYEVIKHWGGINNFNEQKKRDLIKHNFCKINKIKLIIINNLNDINNKLWKILKV